MRILLLIPALNAGGAERVMVTLANEWSKTENVTLMVFNDGHCFYGLDDRVVVKPLNIMPRDGRILRVLSIPSVEIKRYCKIYSEIKNGNYDFVLSFCYTTNIFACTTAIFLKKAKIIISERNDPYRYPDIIKKLIAILYRKCDMVVCQNKIVKNYFTKRGFKNRLIILPNPVNFADIPTERPAIIADEIVTVGRLIEQKNHRLLIEAFDEIKDSYPQYKLKIFGVGPLEKELRAMIAEKGLADRVFLMGAKKRVMFEVNKASIFVLSSDFEGFPNVLIEAMATGMPVISSDFKTGIARELISNDDNGYIFEVGNKADLVEKLKKMLGRSTNFSMIGENNRKVALKYRDEVIAKNWLNSIRQM